MVLVELEAPELEDELGTGACVSLEESFGDSASNGGVDISVL